MISSLPSWGSLSCNVYRWNRKELVSYSLTGLIYCSGFERWPSQSVTSSQRYDKIPHQSHVPHSDFMLVPYLQRLLLRNCISWIGCLLDEKPTQLHVQSLVAGAVNWCQEQLFWHQLSNKLQAILKRWHLTVISLNIAWVNRVRSRYIRFISEEFACKNLLFPMCIHCSQSLNGWILAV